VGDGVEDGQAQDPAALGSLGITALQAAEQAHNWEQIRDITLEQIRQDPLNPDLHYRLGRTYTRLGELTKARQAYEEVLDLDPDHQPTLNALASLTRKSDSQSMSRDVLSRTAKRAPEGPAAVMASIQQALEGGQYQEARDQARQALTDYPNQSGFKFLEGVALEKEGAADEAKIAYQQAIKMDRTNVEAHRALANLYFELGKYVYAALSYGDITELEPSNQEAYYLEGLSYYKAHEWGKAAEAWEALRQVNPQHALLKIMLPQTYYVLAVEYNRNGEAALGRTAFDKAMKLNPNTYSWLPEAMRTLGEYYREKKLYKESLAAYQEVVELRPKDANAYLGMGITYWKMGESQLARAAWDRSLELNPDNNEARGWLMITRQGS
ncbi:MAG: tetratricopeptide repeat protein, partial [Candidatus Neomarinimicrobiota bacterium]